MSAFIRAANSGENHWVFYILTVVVVFVGFFIGQTPLLLVLSQKVSNGKITREQAAAFFEEADFANVGIPSYLGLLLLLGSFITAIIILFIFVKYVHKRSIRLLVNPSSRINVRKILFGFWLWFGLTILAEVVMYMISPEGYSLHFNWSDWIPLLLISVFILPIQTSFEELLTRGYLLQGIGLATKSKWAAIIGSSIIFAAMHLANPEVREFGLGIMMVYYLSVAIFLATITVLDDGLEFALGIHAATNIYGASFVSYTGSALQTDALIRVDQISPVLMLILFYAMMTIFVVIIKRKYNLKPVKSLYSRIQLNDFQKEQKEYEVS